MYILLVIKKEDAQLLLVRSFIFSNYKQKTVIFVCFLKYLKCQKK